MPTDHPLDNPTRASLLGPHDGFAIRSGSVLRYPVDVAPFIATPSGPLAPDDASWHDVAELLGAGQVGVIAGLDGEPPAGWDVVATIPGVQLVDESAAAAPDAEAIELGPDDVADMLDLVARTKPGPFLPRTIELGNYLGIRRDGALVAMAGERMHPPGWTEISAVCTDPAFRGSGLATRLMLAVTAGIRDRGETAFLHAAGTNANAIRLYETLGFKIRREITFVVLRVPGAEAGAVIQLPHG